MPLFGWAGPWDVLRDITRQVRRIGWPIAVILLGVLIIVYSRRPGARLPSRDARLVRSRDKKVIAGVLGGLSEYFSVDVTLLRVGYVLFALIFDAWGPLLVAYIAAAIIVPDTEKTPPPPPPGDTEGGS
ncbi:MAG: PspC domain-containing protein [Coriobacteriia bacterium]|nr:PspC domain-containing protein [Coriobacteriia bacterium]